MVEMRLQDLQFLSQPDDRSALALAVIPSGLEFCHGSVTLAFHLTGVEQVLSGRVIDHTVPYGRFERIRFGMRRRRTRHGTATAIRGRVRGFNGWVGGAHSGGCIWSFGCGNELTLVVAPLSGFYCE